MNFKSSMRVLFTGAVALAGFAAAAETTVTIDKVECGDPWTNVKVDYTLGGIASGIDYKVAFDITSKGETHGVTNAAARLTDGTTTKEIDVTELFKPAKPDPEAQLAVTVIALNPKMGAVQLWAGGPYFAECNVGATKPEEYGYYFWWGDTVGYKRNGSSWVSVKDGKTSIKFSSSDTTAGQTYNKDVATLKKDGWIDDAGNLTLAYDAARVHLGGKWRMPTYAEISKLVSECTTEWKTQNGVSGRLVTGKGDYANKSIFLPAAGYGQRSSLNYPGENGYYWFSTPYSDSSNARNLYFRSNYFYTDTDSRCYGFSVRAVHD